MANATASLWPKDIRVPTRSPQSILSEQAALLRVVTKGTLAGEVTTVTGADEFVIHRLDIVALRLGETRYRIVTVTHRTALYPVVIEAEVFRSRAKRPANSARMDMQEMIDPDAWPRPDDWRPVAASQEEFTAKLSEVFN